MYPIVAIIDVRENILKSVIGKLKPQKTNFEKEKKM